jgi:diphosphomevalonate decarboxylase
VNIAVIKYWGKRDKKLILPTNSSLSVTLDQQELRSTTTARLLDKSNSEAGEEEDQLWLNGARQPIEHDSRLSNCLKELRKLKAQCELQQPETEASLVSILLFSQFFSQVLALPCVETTRLTLDFTYIHIFFIARVTTDPLNSIREQLPNGCRSCLLGLWLCSASLHDQQAIRAADVDDGVIEDSPTRIRLCVSVDVWGVCVLGDGDGE